MVGTAQNMNSLSLNDLLKLNLDQRRDCSTIEVHRAAQRCFVKDDVPPHEAVTSSPRAAANVNA